MELTNFVEQNDVFSRLKAKNKRHLLQDLAEHASKITGISARTIFETLIEREKLGSTGVGHGVAIPHGKLPNLEKLYGLFAHLSRPIPFESIDSAPVDLVFLLLAPEGAGADHLKALARISRTLCNKTRAKKMRATKDPSALFALLTEVSAPKS